MDNQSQRSLQVKKRTTYSVNFTNKTSEKLNKVIDDLKNHIDKQNTANEKQIIANEEQKNSMQELKKSMQGLKKVSITAINTMLQDSTKMMKILDFMCTEMKLKPPDMGNVES